MSQDTARLPTQRWHEATHGIHAVRPEAVGRVICVPGGWTEEGEDACMFMLERWRHLVGLWCLDSLGHT